MTRKRRERKSTRRRTAARPSLRRGWIRRGLVYIALSAFLLSYVVPLLILAAVYLLVSRIRPKWHKRVQRFVKKRSISRTWDYKKQIAALLIVFLFVNWVSVGRNAGTPLWFISIEALGPRIMAVGLLGLYYVLFPLTRSDQARVPALVAGAAAKYRLDPDLIYGFIEVESGFRVTCISDKSACGLMQLMPRTARSLLILNVFHPRRNVEGGTRYIRKLLDRFDGNLKKAIVAYNVGPNRVAQSHGYTAEMNAYYEKVIGARNRRAAGRK